MKKIWLWWLGIGLVLTFPSMAQTQPMRAMDAAEIRLALKKFQVVGNALYVAAHPDDENTRMITYLANERGLRTAYLSLTRGDGGQNLIGKEVRELLGIIRTQELLAARRLDGGEQRFSRANDFGFSKIPKETFTIWDKEQVLADAVWAIRTLKPDVILTRFSPYRAGKTHGHHTGSAIIALEAFEAAADPNRFPEQLQYVTPWQATRIAWNASWWHLSRDSTLNADEMMKMDVGAYNTLLGKSYGEIAAESRSMHKSQGFGSSAQRGSEIEYIYHLAGEKPKNDVLEGIDFTWNRLEGGEKIAQQIEEVIANYDLLAPEKSIPALLAIRTELKQLPEDTPYLPYKKTQLDEIIFQCAGFWADVTSRAYSVAPGDSIHLTARIIRRNNIAVHLNSIQVGAETLKPDTVLVHNQERTEQLSFVLPQNTPYSQPYWLRKPELKGMFQVDEQSLIGLPENPPSLMATISVEMGGETLVYRTPVLFRSTDPVQGERYRPLELTPPVTVNMEKSVLLFSEDTPQEVLLLAKSHTSDFSGSLSLEVPEGWRYEPSSIPLNIEGKYDEVKTAFTLYPPKEESLGEVKAVVTTQNGTFDYALTRITYEHIPVQTLFPKAVAKVVRLDIQTNEEKIGYIPGAGDVIPEALQAIGYSVDVLADEDLNAQTFVKYDVMIMGIRAYNTNPRLKFVQKELMDFVEDGGNMIVQYNTTSGLKLNDVGPYPLKLSRDRVTVEEAQVTFLAPEHSILNYPNKITQADFDGWVQERGLYFPNEWDERYTPIFEMHDPEEDERKGSLLVAHHGKGSYIYTGLSFFRELPAAVPGAYRLFVNLISYKNEEKIKLPKEK